MARETGRLSSNEAVRPVRDRLKFPFSSMRIRMFRTTFLLLTIPSIGLSQSVYDFEGLIGSDTHPFAPLDGQDGWSEETFNAAASMGVTATMSHDGTKSLRFQESGPGFGTDASRINDAAWSYASFSGLEANAYFQADMQVGWWGGSFGAAHDTNGNNQIRGSEAGERGVRFDLGGQSNAQLRLIAANGTATQAPLAGNGISSGNWVRVRVVMDLGANGGTGLGSVEVMNLTTGQTTFTPVAALQAVALALSPSAMDATNPALWDAMWLHFEGAAYGLDNIEFGVLEPGANYCKAAPNSTGSTGVMSASGSLQASANNVTLTAFGLPSNQFGIFVVSMTQAFVPGTNGSSNGNLCLGGVIGRYNGAGQILSTGASGDFSLMINLNTIPQGNGSVAAMAGQSWNFQAWHRDSVGLGSNFTDGYEIQFQ